MATKLAAATAVDPSANRLRGVPRDIPVDQIFITQNNLRTEFDTPEDLELVENIRQNSVLERLLVRDNSKWREKKDKRADYDLIAGERRLRAAKKAGLKTVPCEVFDVDDEKAYELMTVENLQRKDLHELDYAKGFREMMKRYGYSVEQLAQRVDKKETFVRDLLNLANLPQNAVHAFRNGAINKSIAVLIATVPGEKQREDYAKRVLSGRRHSYEEPGKEPLTVREAKDLKEREYMKDLSGAAFPLDQQLDPTWPHSCQTCPDYNGNTPESRQGKRPNICLNPPHYEVMVQLFARSQVKAAEERGATILPENEVKRAFRPPYHGEKNFKLGYDSKYVELQDTFRHYPNKSVVGKESSYASIANKADIQPVIAITPDGKEHRVAIKSTLEAAARKLGYKLGYTSSRTKSTDEVKREAEQRRKNAIKRNVAKALFDRLQPAAAKGFVFGAKPKLIKQLHDVVNLTINDADSNLCKWLCQQLKLERTKSQYSYDYRRPLILYVNQQLAAIKAGSVGNPKAGFLWGFLMRVLVLEKMGYLFDDWRTKPAKENQEMLSHFSLNLNQIESEAAAALKAPPKKKPAKAKAKRAGKMNLAAKPKARAAGQSA